MYKFIYHRLLMMIPVLLGVSFIIFTMMYITPGDPTDMMLPEDATLQDREDLREELNLNDPFITRYTKYVGNIIFHGDFGKSFITKRSVTEEIMQRFPYTLKLATLSVFLSVTIGVITGIIAATKQYSIFDNLSTFFALIGVSMPNFWQGLMLILLFSVQFRLLPASGFTSFKHMILPAVTIGTSAAATIMRMTRSSMLEVVRQDYIRTARAKGQTEFIVIVRHALKNALIPVVTVIGLQFGKFLGGAVLTESIFSIPGLGKLMVDAINMRNYPMVQGGVLYIAIVLSFANLAVDIIYGFIDPRIRSQYTRKKLRRIKREIREEAAGGVSK